MPKGVRKGRIGNTARKAASTANTAQVNADNIVNNAIRSTPGIEFNRGSVSVNPSTGVTHPVGDYGDTVRSAFTQVEGHLTQARQQALGQVPREYHDRVNQAFDSANTQISEHRKRLGY